MYIIKEMNVYFKAMCGWDVASSEIRVSYVFLAFVAAIFGITAIRKHDRTRAQIVNYYYCCFYFY
jgi:hypothetical protein